MGQESQMLSEVDGVNGFVGASEGAHRATGEAPTKTVVRPEPEVVAVAKRRQFSAAYKRRIVREADACQVPGEIGALLRREGLYSSHLTHWRREVEAGEQAALAPKPHGPKPDLARAEARRVEALEREVTRLRQKLGRAEQIIEAQKKLCELLGLPVGEEPSR